MGVILVLRQAQDEDDWNRPLNLPHAEPVEAWAVARTMESILVLRQAQDEDDWEKY